MCIIIKRLTRTARSGQFRNALWKRRWWRRSTQILNAERSPVKFASPTTARWSRERKFVVMRIRFRSRTCPKKNVSSNQKKLAMLKLFLCPGEYLIIAAVGHFTIVVVQEKRKKCLKKETLIGVKKTATAHFFLQNAAHLIIAAIFLHIQCISCTILWSRKTKRKSGAWSLLITVLRKKMLLSEPLLLKMVQ